MIAVDLEEEKKELLKKHKSLRWYEFDLKDTFEEDFFERVW